jgi:hypothetical protein
MLGVGVQDHDAVEVFPPLQRGKPHGHRAGLAPVAAGADGADGGHGGGHGVRGGRDIGGSAVVDEQDVGDPGLGGGAAGHLADPGGGQVRDHHGDALDRRPVPGRRRPRGHGAPAGGERREREQRGGAGRPDPAVAREARPARPPRAAPARTRSSAR